LAQGDKAMLQDLPAPAGSPARAANIIAPLILDFLQWLAAEPRPYGEVMDAWRTSCPRLTVWEDAVDAGYVARRNAGPGLVMVEVTARGRGLLAAEGRAAA
jgi:hypothetical protein